MQELRPIIIRLHIRMKHFYSMADRLTPFCTALAVNTVQHTTAARINSLFIVLLIH